MKTREIIESMAELGHVLRECAKGKPAKFAGKIESVIFHQQIVNPWFTPENVKLALDSIAFNLTDGKLEKWLKEYPLTAENRDPLTIGIIMAGNIPLVGFHDLLSVVVTGNKALVKTSSKDPELPVLIYELLAEINPGFREKIVFSEGTLSGFDAIIATGSNNTSRYFEYYFGKYPSLIRKNRNSIAIISGAETDEELRRTGDDVFTYFGLGCRNVSKLYLPEDFDTDRLKVAWEKYSGLINHSKYASNYEYYKAVYLVNRVPFGDCGYFMLREERTVASPVSVVNYEYFRRDEDFNLLIGPDMDKIQCITGAGMTEPGKAQWPELMDYADGRDTIDFILKINRKGNL